MRSSGQRAYMRVAFITYEYPPFLHGGAGAYAKNITKELAKLGNEVHVITPRLRGCASREIVDGVFVHRVDFIDKPLLRAFSYWLNLRQGFRKVEHEVRGFDIVHGNAVSDFSLDKRITGWTPRVITVHHLAQELVNVIKPSVLDRIRNSGEEVSLLMPFSEGVCIHRADRIIAVSEDTKSKLASIYDVPLDKIEVIYNGWEEMNFALTEKEKAEVRAGYDIGNDIPILLFVGRINDRRKGLDILLRAFKTILTKTDASLFVAGSGNQKPFKDLSSSLGITSRVTFAGFVDDVTLQKLYSICNVYVCPSRLEGFGLTILDAMAAGKPIVATKVGAIPEIVKVGGSAFLVQDNNEDELAMAIIQVLGSSLQAKARGENNRKWVQTHYCWEFAARRVAEVYTKLSSV